MKDRELTIRSAVLVLAAVLGVIAPDLVVTGLVMLGVVASSAELAVRPWSTSLLTRTVMACGGLLVFLVLGGLVLNLLPWGLTRPSWTVLALTAAASILIVRRARLPQRPSVGSQQRLGRPAPSAVGWAAATGVVLVAAVLLAVVGGRDASTSVLAFAVTGQTARDVQVEVQGDAGGGSYDIVAVAVAAPGGRPLAPQRVTVAPGARVPAVVSLPGDGRWRIELRDAGQGAALRYLIVDVPSPDASRVG
jgi:hypothetical protein